MGGLLKKIANMAAGAAGGGILGGAAAAGAGTTDMETAVVSLATAVIGVIFVYMRGRNNA